MTLEQRSLLRHDRLSGEWSDKYYARRFPRNMDEYDIWKRHRLYLDFLESIGPVDHALEIGCGTGDNIAKCRSRIRDGIDVSPKMIEAAQRRHTGINFSAMDVMDGKLEPGYDLIIALGVIQYVTDHPRFLEIVAGLLTPGGHLVVSFPNVNSVFRNVYYARSGAAGRQRDHSAADVCGRLERSGLTRIQLSPHSSGLPGTGRLSAPLWLAATFVLDGLYGLPGFKAVADHLAYSYLGLFRKVE